MKVEHPLSAAFLSVRDAAGVPSGFSVGAELETVLADGFARGKNAWPDVHLDPLAFVRYVALRCGKSSDLPLLKLEDLYVACACVQRQEVAVRAVLARYFVEVDLALRKMNLPPAKIEDVKQTVQRVLFVGDDGEPPRLSQYGGKGDLKAWLRVSGVRAALKVIRKEKREVLVEDEAIFEHGTRDIQSADPELSYIKEVYREQFRAAFQSALDGLSDREKTMLRQHIIDGLSIDDLAALQAVHRATAARWLAKSKETLLERTRRVFMQNAHISGHECDSILRMVHSQLDATIRRRLLAS